VADEGRGIDDVDLAMREGYSTASNKIREMGFGAGMGLPNIKKNADEFEITSEVSKGTRLFIRVSQVA
jgi:anti-sigma regulatory factor (Ser/Thr protein kinase)